MVGVFGGTFDPFHRGHLQVLDTVLSSTPVTRIQVVPASVPPMRPQPRASAEHRARMVELAIAGRGSLYCDRREIEREGVSYTVLSLREMRDEGLGPLVLILGRDAFDRLPGWHRHEELRALADIVVLNRPGHDDAGTPPPWMNGEPFASSLDAAAAGGQVVALTMPPVALSATELRRRLAAGEDVRDLVPDDVYTYLQVHRLYA